MTLEVDDLQAWFDTVGIDRGFWSANQPPEELEALWDDISYAINDLDQYVSCRRRRSTQFCCLHERPSRIPQPSRESVYLGGWRVKYMGSKRWMLNNGLAELIQSVFRSMSGLSICFVALQLCHGMSHVTTPYRCWPATSRSFAVSWLRQLFVGLGFSETTGLIAGSTGQRLPRQITRYLRPRKNVQHCSEELGIVEYSTTARELCSKGNTRSPQPTVAHYFSPLQAVYFDCLRSAILVGAHTVWQHLLPWCKRPAFCAASPGHTAQPFGQRFLQSPTSAMRGQRMCLSVFDIMASACRRSTRRSKAWHCLVTLTRSLVISGRGTWCSSILPTLQFTTADSITYSKPSLLARRSKSQESGAIHHGSEDPDHDIACPQKRTLLCINCWRRDRECRSGVIVTFPAGMASNGLSGQRVIDIARNWFTVDYIRVKSRFSTLGGNTRNRSARMRTEELLLSLEPK